MCCELGRQRKSPGLRRGFLLAVVRPQIKHRLSALLTCMGTGVLLNHAIGDSGSQLHVSCRKLEAPVRIVLEV